MTDDRGGDVVFSRAIPIEDSSHEKGGTQRSYFRTTYDLYTNFITVEVVFLPRILGITRAFSEQREVSLNLSSFSNGTKRSRRLSRPKEQFSQAAALLWHSERHPAKVIASHHNPSARIFNERTNM
jgi:hypothetical protein